jgi:hypothetical protein
MTDRKTKELETHPLNWRLTYQKTDRESSEIEPGNGPRVSSLRLENLAF